jgi:hypothetical protein
MAQITNISSGQLIDQSLISKLIETVNSISNNQYSSVSGIGTPGVSDVTNVAFKTANNGEWIVSTGYDSVTMTTSANDWKVSPEQTLTFKKPFSTIPIITATAYSTVAAAAIQTDTVYSIVVTSVSPTDFKYKVMTYSKTSGSTSFGIMYTAIGRTPSVTS